MSFSIGNVTDLVNAGASYWNAFEMSDASDDASQRQREYLAFLTSENAATRAQNTDLEAEYNAAVRAYNDAITAQALAGTTGQGTEPGNNSVLLLLGAALALWYMMR